MASFEDDFPLVGDQDEARDALGEGTPCVEDEGKGETSLGSGEHREEESLEELPSMTCMSSGTSSSYPNKKSNM